MDIRDYEETKQRLIAEGWGPLTSRPCGTAEMAAMCISGVIARRLAESEPAKTTHVIGEAIDIACLIDIGVRARFAEQHVNEPEPTGKARLDVRNLKKRGGK